MSNEEQIAYWNGRGAERWTTMQARLDEAMAPFGEAAMRAGDVRRGERVLDVGCGCGATAMALAERVGGDGDVEAVDVSAPMLARARARATHLANLRFVEADAATRPFTRDRTLVFSRFGVMFFEDPTGAFTNLRGALAPGGRLAFVCWRALGENAWMNVPLASMRDLVPAPPPSDPRAPGPFAFADRAHVEHVLTSAGFDDVRLAPFDAPVVLSQSGIDEAVEFSMRTGPVSARTASADERTIAAVRTRVRDSLAPHTTDSRVALPGAAWIVTARSS